LVFIVRSKKVDKLTLGCCRRNSKLEKCLYFQNKQWITNFTKWKNRKGKMGVLGQQLFTYWQKRGSYLFKHGFLDENVLALRVDSKDEYAFLVNENKYEGELNSINKIADFLTKIYLEPIIEKLIDVPITDKIQTRNPYNTTWINTNKGKLEIKSKLSAGYTFGDLVFLNGEPAPDGKYVNGWPSSLYYLVVEDGKLKNI